MGNLYSLGGRRRRLHRPRFAPTRLIAFLLFAAIAFFLIFNFQLYPGVAALARSLAENEAERKIAAAFSERIAAAPADYEDMISIRYRTDGAIAGITCHTGKLNRARNELLLAVLRNLREENAVTVDLPLGNIFGGEAFSGRGPTVPIRVLVAEGAHGTLKSDFRTAGINQTVHRILFSVTVTLVVMTPSRPIETTVTQEFCVAETVIVGDVPDAFTQINRLTDDIREGEIDDIFDYGAEVPQK